MILKQPDGRDPGRAGLHTGWRIVQRDPAQSQHRDFLPAGFPQSLETRRAYARFFEDGPEDDEIGAFLRGPRNLGWGVTRCAYGHTG